MPAAAGELVADVSLLAGGRAEFVAESDLPPATLPEGISAAGPAFEITGDLPAGGATIGLPSTVNDPSIAAGYFNEATGEWEIVGGVFDPGTGLVMVHTDHLSIWRAFLVAGWGTLSTLVDALNATVSDLTGTGDQGQPPSCAPGGLLPSVVATHSFSEEATDAVFKLDVCSEPDPAGGYRVKIVNRRPVAVRLSIDDASAVVASVDIPNAGDLVGLGIDKLGRILGQPALGGMLISPGGRLELIVAGPSTITGEVDSAGSMWTVLLAAAGSYGGSGLKALGVVADGYDFTANAANTNWAANAGDALLKLMKAIASDPSSGLSGRLVGPFTTSLVVAVRGAIEGGLAPWYGNGGVRIDLAAPEAPSSATVDPDRLLEMLRSAPVPSLCDNQAGNLVDGALPTDLLTPWTDEDQPPGVYLLEEPAPLLGDIEGDGTDEIIAGVLCTYPSYSYPSGYQSLVIWDTELNVLGTVDMDRRPPILVANESFGGITVGYTVCDPEPVICVTIGTATGMLEKDVDGYYVTMGTTEGVTGS